MRFHAVLLIVLGARLIEAQVAEKTRATGASITGVVYDSIAGAPLAGANVQLAAADTAGRFSGGAVSDSLGRFAIEGVPNGKYLIGFLHPLLDSLGLQPTLRAVSVVDLRAVRADLAIPSPARLRATICGPQKTPDASGLVIGVVRGARDDEAIGGVAVAGEWLELTITPTGLVRKTPRLVATTGDNGWFAMCNVPSPGTMTLMAGRGADSTDVVEVQVPANGFLRRQLYLGSARSVVVQDTSSVADTVAPRRVRVGDGRLSGFVVSTVGDQPLEGAQVGIANGPQTRANARGEWTLVGAPTGTRMLEVHAISYYPERRAVNIVAGAAPVRIALSTFKSVLDTVKVVAGRGKASDRAGFAERRQSGGGKYLTADDIARRQSIVTSDIFRMIPGVRVQFDTNRVDKQLLLRGRNGSDWCTASIYLDGHHMEGLSAGDVDSMVRPTDIVGIEVYAGTDVPPQFQQAFSACGSIVIWMK